MSPARTYDLADDAARAAGLDDAVATVSRGGLVVLPTDTVYGVGADAFDPRAVARLLAAKGRGRQMPPPVLVADPAVMDALAVRIPAEARDLARAFWPGGLTLILLAQPSLAWDLGDTDGTVALRMPADENALALLRRTGPLAVSSANRTGHPAAPDCADAVAQLGDAVEVYLDGGPSAGGVSSTIVDATAPRLTILRDGAIPRTELAAVAPELALDAPRGAGAQVARPPGGPAAP